MFIVQRSIVTGCSWPVTWRRTVPEQSHVTRHVLAGARTLATNSGSVV